ncbi:MAG TPA: VOC family protein [Anaerolineales bacterium]|nr:VOC family protein [Anaerolineales bacterium]
MTKPGFEPGQPLPFLKSGIAQIAILVKDLEETVQNYWSMFGIGPWHFYTYAKPLVKQMSYHGHPAEYKMRLALSQIGPLRIELIEVKEGESIYADFIKEHGYGVHHLGILVDDMNAALAKADSSGFNMIQDGSGFGLDGDGHYAYLETEESLGITLQLIQRPKARVKPEKIYPPDIVS